jgi:hypothetical protein
MDKTTHWSRYSSVVDCSSEGCIISDGGIRHPGYVAKALGTGSDFVMIGSGEKLFRSLNILCYEFKTLYGKI